MNLQYKSIEQKRKHLKSMKEKLASGQLNALRELLPGDMIEQFCEEAGYYFRTRLLSPVVTVFHMIATAIGREGSFQSSWHSNGQTGQSASLTKARKRLPLCVWQRIDQWTKDRIFETHDSRYLWHGHRVIGIDGTCVSMSDEPGLVNHFGRNQTYHGASRFPIARMAIAFNLLTLVSVAHEMADYKTHERTLARRLTPRLKAGDILVEDRGFAGAYHYWELGTQGLYFINRSHQSLRVELLEVVKVLGAKDHLVKLPFSKHARLQNPSLPQYQLLRVLQVTAPVRGQKQTFWLITSLLDSHRYSASAIRQLYKRRWRIEGLIGELKVWLSADILRSKSVDQIYKEMQARIVALNLIHWLILEAAKKHRKTPERISVAATLRLAATYSLKMSTAPAWQLWPLYEELLRTIVNSYVPYRPNRVEPRMIKRETKYYPMLKISRFEWRSLCAMAA